MKIEYQDKGAVAKLVITSSVLELRRHNRAVDTALFLANVIARRSGWLLMKTTISGKSRDVLRAYRAVINEVSRA